MPPPPLTRQNAFYCERSQDKTPLDPHCSICHRELYALCKFIRPCRCEPEDTIPLYAHQECFVNWFILHGCPRQCPACKSNYHIPYSFYLAVSVLKKNRYQLIFIALLILSIFIFTHVARCTNFQILTRQEFINQFGEEQYRNVPERLIMPRISISCLATSFDNLTLSALYCTFITVVSIAFSCFIVLLKFYIK